MSLGRARRDASRVRLRAGVRARVARRALGRAPLRARCSRAPCSLRAPDARARARARAQRRVRGTVAALRGEDVLGFRYKSCGYGPAMKQIPESWLDGAENAILDFRYTESKQLAWYFDHHLTGFGSEDERARAVARAESSGPTFRVFFDA